MDQQINKRYRWSPGTIEALQRIAAIDGDLSDPAIRRYVITAAVQPSAFRAARTARWASSVALFVGAYVRRKPPPRRHHQRSTCELITAAKIRSPAATAICLSSCLDGSLVVVC